MISIIIHLPTGRTPRTFIIGQPRMGLWHLELGTVGVKVAAFVLQAAAAPAAFIPTQLVAGAGHDRWGHRRLRPQASKRWTLGFGLVAPQLGDGGIALVVVEIRQTLEHVSAVLERRDCQG